MRLTIALLAACALARLHPASAASYTVSYAFGPPPDAYESTAPLIAGNGVLYGTSRFGGSAAKGTFSGTVFTFDPATGAEKVLSSFGGGTDGTVPAAGLVQHASLLYGTTMDGGPASSTCTVGCGTVFSVDPVSGARTTLHRFSGPDGASPAAGLIVLGNSLYGTTGYGGANGYGTVFSLDPATGAQRVLYSFRGPPQDGATPLAALVAYRGSLYGTTVNGGTGYYGTVFAIDGPNRERLLHSFTSGADGQWPQAGLLPVAGKLYGTTQLGGAPSPCASGCGTIFSIDPLTGAESVVHAFNGTDGATIDASLIDAGGTLLGTASEGGPANGGTIFTLSPATGAVSVLYSFEVNRKDGHQPKAPLLIHNGQAYGTTYAGGTSGAGTIFVLTP